MNLLRVVRVRVVGRRTVQILLTGSIYSTNLRICPQGGSGQSKILALAFDGKKLNFYNFKTNCHHNLRTIPLT